jgi:hypothetical protein
VRLAILGCALALIGACGGASQSVDTHGANANREDPVWRDPSGSRQESYTPAHDSPASRKTGK